ncbi:hypothetical protein [Phaffia rhodozyma]|uniref:Uncharacterized protein n=1 Tax=Phaffia rhodozyma TaxID=264483 RepID=A0A0F7STG4_PHARH|nr:hypothetical protein [Phaffia rhodozyma]
MWPFSSKPSETSSASVVSLPPPSSLPPTPVSPPTLEPIRAGPPGGLAAPSKPVVPVTKADEGLGSANVLQIPDSGGTFVRGLDTGSLLTVLAGVFISTTGPRFFGITNPSRRTFFVLGTWSLTSWALVIHLTQRFRDQDLQNKWAAANSGPGTGPDFEGGVGGQESLKDKYATTRGDH